LAVNRDLSDRVADGRFRDDLLARINLWTFRLPALRDRREDIEPNLEYELSQFSKRTGRTVRFSTEARERFLSFATAPEARWTGNFRDLSASITRMATLSPAGRIVEPIVESEIARLRIAWTQTANEDHAHAICVELFGEKRAAELDRFDRVQLVDVLSVCRRARSLSEAGRGLFAESRRKKTSGNDADRLRKYLARFGVSWKEAGQAT
jgi:transcriptional regulatory protein RtcR